MTNATNNPAENDTMEDRATVTPTASAVLRPVAMYMENRLQGYSTNLNSH